MKKYAVLLAFVILAFSVPLAQSSTTGTPQRLAKLEKQVRVLQSQMKSANKRLACVSKAASITSYGVPSSNEGYLYQRPTATPSQFPTTALDFTLQGDKADALVAVVDPKCVTSTAATASLGTRRAQHHVVLVRLNRNW
jgi:hypothetical protein